MKNYNVLYDKLEQAGAAQWAQKLRSEIPQILSSATHGDLAGWQKILNALPDLPADIINLNNDAVSVSSNQIIHPQTIQQLKQALLQFHPWRKGPFHIYGVEIDAEWRSDLKWNRLKESVDLRDKWVLDVGCGNGYYGWRMLGAGAETVVGIEPFLKNVLQYEAISHFIGEQPFYVLPVGVQDLPDNLQLFDTVFSMGVLYHRRSPLDHLFQLKSFLKTGGELVLETLIIEGTDKEALVPKDRYAKMRNVWFLPSTAALQSWLERAGFLNIRLLNISRTTIEEQRSTAWMAYESLPDFLDPENPNQTIEGYPAPLRAMFSAKKTITFDSHTSLPLPVNFNFR